MTRNAEHTYWDAAAATYGQTESESTSWRLKTALLERFVKPADHCLDVGSANGSLLIPLASRVARAYGIDSSAKMLELLKKRITECALTNVEVRQSNAASLPFDNNFFNFVYCFSTLVLIPNVQACLREMARVLKPNGIAIVDIAGRNNLSYRHWTAYYRSRAYSQLSAFSLVEARALLASAGLRIKETHASGVLDQWKYIPLLWRFSFLDNVFHSLPELSSLDYRLSQRFSERANRWFFVVEKA